MDSIKMDFTVAKLVDSYIDGQFYVSITFCSQCSFCCLAGSHPYYCFQASMIKLVSKGGNVFYSSLLQFMLDFEHAHPEKVHPHSDMHSPNAFFVSSTCPHHPSALPLEILEHIFSLVSTKHLLPEGLMSHAWCMTASRFSHSKVIFHLHPNWQGFDGLDDDHKHETEAYALIYQLMLICAATQWHFSGWIHTLISEHWLEIQVPFFFHALKNVQTVTIHSSTSTNINHYPIIPSTYFLPDSVCSLYLYQCSLHCHSLKGLISLCMNLRFLSMVSIHYSHVVSVHLFMLLYLPS